MTEKPDHAPEYVGVLTKNGYLRWRCYCTCGWYTPTPQSTAYWAQQEYQKHLRRVELRRTGSDVR